MGIDEHQAFLSVGCKLNDQDCKVPTLGVHWQPFHPFVYLPLHKMVSDPGPGAPFTSITEWTWHSVSLGGDLVSASKRDAYLQYVDIPQRSRRTFELAANIAPADNTGDRELLRHHGWKVPDPQKVARSPAAYRAYIRTSRAEFACVKPVYRELRTGWLSDRSACYLAAGRPVLVEDTGIGDCLPTGQGLLIFRSLDEAVAQVNEIDGNYLKHHRAARDLAVEYLNSERQLERMLVASARQDRPSE
jgi:hypothetical protein